ncbi:ECF-type sigma factor [Kallipyga massiliensis]|uniref:ECF-type sigma factor n=1 Tax=Kallipyga massiliensis TaxID=1472764 RepID=UPI0026F33C61|nr:ECF-type sigma factor [Kallipyga massiliensis]
MNNNQRKSETRKVIIQLLRRHQSNVDKYSRIKSDPTIREWKADYMMRKATGGIVAENYERKPGKRNAHASIEETLLVEKSNVFDQIHRIELQIQVVRILLLSLQEENVRLVELRYFCHLPVEKVCEALYCSRSTFYRRHDLVLDELTDEFDRLFTEEDREILIGKN